MGVGWWRVALSPDEEEEEDGEDPVPDDLLCGSGEDSRLMLITSFLHWGADSDFAR